MKWALLNILFLIQAMYESDPNGSIEKCKDFMTAGYKNIKTDKKPKKKSKH